jgi:hypothetical protein
METRKIGLGLFVFLGFFLATSMVFAYEEGVNKLTVGLDFSVGNDSNIVETADGTEDNFVMVLPQLVLTMPREQSFFYLSYSLRYDQYLDNSEFNNTSHNVDFLSRFEFGSNFMLEIKDKFIDSLYGLWRDETDTTSGEGYFNNMILPTLKYEADSGSFVFDLGFAYTLERWDKVDGSDWDAMKALAKFGFGLGNFSKLSVFGDFTNKDYDVIDADYTGVFAGVQFDHSMPEIVDVMARVGYETRDYDNASIKDPKQTSWEVSVNKLFTELTSAKFTLYNHYADSEVALGDYYASLGGKLDFSYLMMDKIQLFLQGEYLDNNYQILDRDDKVSRAYIGAGYKLIDWLALQLFYSYSKRDSNLPVFDIEDSRIELHLNFLKDFLF